MEAVLLLAVVGAMNVLCFLIGAKVGQTAFNGEKIELPSLNPMEAIREQQDKKQARKEQEKVDAILRNVEAYNGTSHGQEDVPRG